MSTDTDFYLKDTFIESPIFDNWFKKHYPQKSLLICSPYIKKDAIDKVIDLYDLENRDSNFELKVIIRGNSDEFTYQKSSDVAAFDSLISLKCLDLANVRRISNLHMKAYLIDEKHLLITSGNMTNSGMFVISSKENFEGGISTNDVSIIFSFLHYLSGIWNQSQPLDDFYDDLMSAYEKYIETEYSDKGIYNRLNKTKHHFKIHSSFDGLKQFVIDNSESEKKTSDDLNIKNGVKSDNSSLDSLINTLGKHSPIYDQHQLFTLSDIPPVGRLEYLPDTLQIINSQKDGISYLELGKQLRQKFSDNDSNTDGANKKFGEEKGKFAAFLGLVYIDRSNRNNVFKINNLGKSYIRMSEENRNKLIKDIFFDKPIVVSILRHSMEQENFDLLTYLKENCEGAEDSTLARKVGPLKDLFLLINNICTETELKEALANV